MILYNQAARQTRQKQTAGQGGDWESSERMLARRSAVRYRKDCYYALVIQLMPCFVPSSRAWPRRTRRSESRWHRSERSKAGSRKRLFVNLNGSVHDKISFRVIPSEVEGSPPSKTDATGEISPLTAFGRDDNPFFVVYRALWQKKRGSTFGLQGSRLVRAKL